MYRLMCVNFRLLMKRDSIRLKIRKTLACIPNLHKATRTEAHSLSSVWVLGIHDNHSSLQFPLQ